MMEFGKSLRSTREAKGLTVAQLTEMTHLAPTTIEELESEDFSHIAAPIYGRGFVKLYCEAVGLDPKPFVAEFMELVSGAHDIGIRERPVTSASEPPTEPSADPDEAEAPIPTEPPTDEIPPVSIPSFVRQKDLFGEDIPSADGQPAEATRPMPPPLSAETEPPLPTIHEPAAAQTDNHSFSRYAEPLHQLKPIISSHLWRIGVLAGFALLLLALLALGIRAIYRATNTRPEHAQEHLLAETTVEAKAPEADKPTTSAPPAADAIQKAPAPSTRKPQNIPALYID